MLNEPKFVFWPVGNGDSTTIVINENVVMQVDLRQIDTAGNDCVNIIESLVSNLPERNQKPYLACFALTHPDEDHICGFSDLYKQVSIGEIWTTPRIFYEKESELCDDAKFFKEEVIRRIETVCGGNSESGNLVRIIGKFDNIRSQQFNNFPDKFVSEPRTSINMIDGDYCDNFNAFIHAPFEDSFEGERNESSLAMQVVLGNNPENGVLFFGDLSYPSLIRIFDERKQSGELSFLKWSVLLAPHHCSKSAMYQNEGGQEKPMQDILEKIKSTRVGLGIIISSSEKISGRDESGDNPPHKKAKDLYEENSNHFYCTTEDGEKCEPIIFNLINNELICSISENGSKLATTTISEAVNEARGTDETPTEKVEFGNDI